MLSFIGRTAADRSVVLGLQFVGANPHVVLEGEDRAPGDANYLHGNDPAAWHTQVPRFARVIYRELWPHVDMMLRGDSGMLKYEFRVRPGARIADIQLAYDGAKSLALGDNGALAIDTSVGVIRDSRPTAYQTIGAARVPVESRYVVKDNRYGFAIGAAHDAGHDLVIDPGIEYSTFLGGASHESAAAVAVDSAGNAYITGVTQSPDFPTTAGAFDRTGAPNNFLEAFVSKLNSNGTALVYSTFLGGADFDSVGGIAVDGGGNVFVAGGTSSLDFPTTPGAYDRTLAGGDAFVTKLNPAGSALVYSTFIGGSGGDSAAGVIVDASGNAWIAGGTNSADFPTTPGSALDTTINGAGDVFLAELDATGSALRLGTFLGGSDSEGASALAFDPGGNIIVVGQTMSQDFPTTAGALDRVWNGDPLIFWADAFVTKFAVGSPLPPPQPPPPPPPHHRRRREEGWRRPRSSAPRTMRGSRQEPRSRSIGAMSPVRRATRSRSTTPTHSQRRSPSTRQSACRS